MQEDKPLLFGEPYSVYVRAVRLALEEKSVEYELVPVDIFNPGGPPPEHKARHPFGKIPAFEHAGFCLCEAGAFTRYVDEAPSSNFEAAGKRLPRQVSGASRSSRYDAESRPQ